MERKIEAFLRLNGNWKELITEDRESLKDALLVDLDIITLQQEGQRVHFDVSIVYRLLEESQKQIYESGVAVVSEKGDVQLVKGTKIS